MLAYYYLDCVRFGTLVVGDALILAFESIFERVVVPVGFGISLSAGMATSFVVCCFIVFVYLR